MQAETDSKLRRTQDLSDSEGKGCAHGGPCNGDAQCVRDGSQVQRHEQSGRQADQERQVLPANLDHLSIAQ